MALRSSFALVILLLVLQQLKLCKGEMQTAEVYEIDYKGPETHAFLPPPDHSRFAPSTGNKSKKPKVWKALANTLNHTEPAYLTVTTKPPLIRSLVFPIDMAKTAIAEVKDDIALNAV